MEENKFENELELFCKEVVTPDNILQAFDCLLPSVSFWNPELAVVLKTFISTIKLGVNIFSKRKAEQRIVEIVKTIEKIYKRQQAGETNYEAALICPELFRKALILEDEDRVREHLALIEQLFSSGKYDFDKLSEALRLVNQLSSMEYRILKLIPVTDTKWDDILEREEFVTIFETQRQQLAAAFLSLINMNLVVKKLVIRHDGGPELGTINFDDELEYIRLSAYGQLFLETMEEVRKKNDDCCLA
jgi:hypothetical protein